MKNMLLKIGALVAVAALCAWFSGCGNKTEYQDAAQAEDAKHLVIETGGNDIVLTASDSDEFTASIVGYDEPLWTQDGDTLRIFIPMPDTGVNTKSPQPLKIGVPSKELESLSITSTTGNVSIKSVPAKEITVNTEYGAITISELAGTVDAKTDMGLIKSGLTLSSDIVAMENGYGASYKGSVGDKTEKTITLISSLGNITIN